MDTAQVMKLIERDKPFYDASGGGATFSGGEPMLSPKALLPLLQATRAAGIHTAVDTAGNIPWAQYAPLLPLTSLFLVDFKARDAAVHREATGADNRLILENLRQFAACGVPVTIRIPVVPGVNSGAGEMGAMADYLAEINFRGPVELLKLHHWGEAKYQALGRAYPLAGTAPPSDSEMEHLREVFCGRGLKATIG